MSRMIQARMERCVRCQGCEVACQREHEGQSNMYVVLTEERFGVPLNCRHCNPAPCATVCPAEAITTVKGLVHLDPTRCTGCTLCLFACPFGVIGFNIHTGKAAKCDLCARRRAMGIEPACALTCPSMALSYCEPGNGSMIPARRIAAAALGGLPLAGGF